MSDGTDKLNKQALIDAIKALVYTNSSNEVSADDEQTALLNIVETLYGAFERIEHNNTIDRNSINAHELEAIATSNITSDTLIAGDNVFLKKNDTWIKVTMTDIADFLKDVTETLTNKTISAVSNSITDLEITDITNLSTSLNNKMNKITTLYGNNFISTDSAGQLVSTDFYYLNSMEAVYNFLRLNGNLTGVLTKNVDNTYHTDIYIGEGAKKIIGNSTITIYSNIDFIASYNYASVEIAVPLLLAASVAFINSGSYSFDMYINVLKSEFPHKYTLTSSNPERGPMRIYYTNKYNTEVSTTDTSVIEFDNLIFNKFYSSDSTVLTINSSNVSTYYQQIGGYDFIVNVPNNIDIIFIDYPIEPYGVRFLNTPENGKRISIIGNDNLAYACSQGARTIEGAFSQYLYGYLYGVYGGGSTYKIIDAFVDFIYWNGVFYSKSY
jgi:hypothetical protein